MSSARAGGAAHSAARAIFNTQAMLARLLMETSSGRNHARGFDDISHVARRVPQRVHGLALADPVDRTHLQRERSLARRRECRLPFAEGIAAQILAQMRCTPRPSPRGPKPDLPH